MTIVDVASESQSQTSVYSPGSTVQLMCSADDRFGSVTVIWSSTCTGNCFVLQQTTQDTITTDALHVADSGNHTCSVTDEFGNTGNSTYEIIVSDGMLTKYIQKYY